MVQFFGAPEKQGLCSGCYMRKFPQAALADASVKQDRQAPLKRWEAEWKAAVDRPGTVNPANIARLLGEYTAAKEEATDGDAVLSKRHSSRMRDLIGSYTAQCVQDGTTDLAKALVDGGLSKILEPRIVWASLWDWRASAGIDFVDVLLQDDDMAAALSNTDLMKAVVLKPIEFVQKLLEPRFTDSDQMFVTDEVSDNLSKPLTSPTCSIRIAFVCSLNVCNLSG